MEDNLNFCVNGRQPTVFVNGRQTQIVCKWKTSSILSIQDKLFYLWNGKLLFFLVFFRKIEDDLNYLVNRRQPQLFDKWKKTSICKSKRILVSFEMEDDPSFLLGKEGVASPSFSWAWHSSAPACSVFLPRQQLRSVSGWRCLQIWAVIGRSGSWKLSSLDSHCSEQVYSTGVQRMDYSIHVQQ